MNPTDVTFYLGQMHAYFDTDPSTVFMLKPFTNYTEGADSVRLTGAISVSVNIHGNKERAHFHGITSYVRVCRKSEGWTVDLKS